MFLSKKRKGMELPINTLVILIMLLVLIVVVLILVSRGASNFTDIGEDKIDTSGDVTNCEILCWECCRAPPTIGKCEKPIINAQCDCLC